MVDLEERNAGRRRSRGVLHEREKGGRCCSWWCGGGREERSCCRRRPWERERTEEGRRWRCEEAEGAAGPHPGWAAFAFAVGKAMFWVTDPCPVQDPNPRMGTPFR